MAMGEVLFTILSNGQYFDPRASASGPSSPASGNSMQHDDSLRTAITSIGRMVLNTFTRTFKELDNSPLDRDSNRQCLAGLIRAMLLADGTKACMTLFQHLRNQLSPEQRRATLDVVQNIYMPVDFLAEDSGHEFWHSEIGQARTYDYARHTELYRLRDVQNWECVQTALTAVYAYRDPVSIIQITTTVLAICRLSVQNIHTLPAEESRGAYLADMLRQFDEHLATLRRKELKDAVQRLPPAAVYRLDWVLNRMTDDDIYGPLSTTEIRRDAMMSTNHIARRLQWLLGCDVWTPPWTVQGFCVFLRVYVGRTQGRLEQDHGLDRKNWEGWLECAPDEPQSEDDRRVDSLQAAVLGPTSEAGDEQDPPESRMNSPKRPIMQIIRDVWRKLRGTAAQEPDAEKGAAGADTNATQDAPGATDAAPPAVSGAPPVTATTVDEPPQGQDAAQTGSVQSLDYEDPHADDSGAARGVAEHGADADEGCQGGLVGATEHADEHQGGDAGPSQEGLAAPGDTPTQPSESHFESASQNANSG
ncbi:uncharacterized protein B0H18DRAFT_359011 [Fomitopsis serialis]|uniref:uncharacterized protein n=1 Tax=Fomitopsis serialis TaxID=139415 RepID=UPI002007C55D|nr:uncharacterized protein B0H18DRAFT_359011 [Neoantrodia serialis]KAH9925982.1 hypothetical protein B0H18DRAFT_359011 [Neoantrodia serialis]